MEWYQYNNFIMAPTHILTVHICPNYCKNTLSGKCIVALPTSSPPYHRCVINSFLSYLLLSLSAVLCCSCFRARSFGSVCLFAGWFFFRLWYVTNFFIITALYWLCDTVWLFIVIIFIMIIIINQIKICHLLRTSHTYN